MKSAQHIYLLIGVKFANLFTLTTWNHGRKEADGLKLSGRMVVVVGLPGSRQRSLVRYASGHRAAFRLRLHGRQATRRTRTAFTGAQAVVHKVSQKVVDCMCQGDAHFITH